MDIPSMKLTFSHLKMDGWNTIISFWDGLFSGDMLVSGSVFVVLSALACISFLLAQTTTS